MELHLDLGSYKYVFSKKTAFSTVASGLASGLQEDQY